MRKNLLPRYFRLISCSNTETQAELPDFSPERLGNWQPGNQLTREVPMLTSSRLKAAESRGVITERKPVVPSVIAAKVDFFVRKSV